MRALVLFVAALGAALAAGGCGGVVDPAGERGAGGEGGAGGSTAHTAEEADAACEEYSNSVCTKELQCFPGREDVVGSQDNCATRMKIRCLSRLPLPDTSVTPASLLACAEAMSADGCEMFDSVPEGCRFLGVRAVGDPCGDGAQCQSGRCDPLYHDGCGFCAEPKGLYPRCLDGCKSKGVYCGYPNAGSCGYGQVCPGDLCIPGPKEGESCGYDYTPCTYPASCLSDVCTIEVPSACDPT